MGDIEKFFNDNFFKKVNSEPEADLQIKRDFEEERREFMHGVPESAYEPTVMPENDNEKQHANYKANDPFRAAVRRMRTKLSPYYVPMCQRSNHDCQVSIYLNFYFSEPAK